jgi:Ca-activated chloride channel family protein
MCKAIPILLVSLLWLGVGSTVALADGMILPQTLSADLQSVAVRYHHVTVRIEDGHAVTHVEQEFYNPYDVPVAGRYLFPIPPEAILSRFDVTVDGQKQTVARQDRAATNAALNASVAQQHDPSLLQYADWESLAFDLSLPPGSSRRMSLEYEQVLAPDGGLFRYRYVLSTERYSSRPVEEVSLTVDLHSSSGLASVYSPSHAVSVQRLGPGRARVSWAAQDVSPAEDFEMFFAPAEKGFGGGLLTGRAGQADGHDHLLFLFAPEAEPRQGETLPKDIVFVLDRSGSMGGDKIEQARNALHYILGQLGEDDQFSIISFNDRLAVWDDAVQPVEDRTVQDARRFVDRLTADGSTDLEAALQTAMEILLGTGVRGATRMIVFLTDGLPTAGIADEQLIARQVADTNVALEARLHVFGVGYDVNTHLLDRLAADNGGTVTYVEPGENLELALTSFSGKIAYPVLTDVEVEFQGLEAEDLYPETLPDLFQGSSLLLTGRYQAADKKVTVRVRGRAGDERREYVYHFDLDKTGGHDFVPRLWATRRVGALLDRVRVEGESPSLVEEIRDLGLSYGIVTPYTTFVVAAQDEGAASAASMDLYNNQIELNQVSGRVTIQARVQNQAYQQAEQAAVASGANVSNVGQRNLAQVGAQQIDLSLLRGQKAIDEPISGEWIARHVKVDRTVEFGSEEYFALAADPEARPFLQSGRNVLFAYKGQVIAVQDPDPQTAAPDGPEALASTQSQGPAATLQIHPSDAGNTRALVSRLVVYGAVLVLGLSACLGLFAVAVLIIDRGRRA